MTHREIHYQALELLRKIQRNEAISGSLQKMKDDNSIDTNEADRQIKVYHEATKKYKSEYFSLITQLKKTSIGE